MCHDVRDAPALATRLEIGDHLIHRSDEHVGAGEDLVRRQPAEGPGQGGGRLATVVGHDHALHQRVELEMLVAVASHLADQPHALVRHRRATVRDVHLSRSATKHDAREADDVGFPRGQREQPWRVAADEDGRARALHGARVDRVAGHPIVPAGEGHRFALE